MFLASVVVLTAFYWMWLLSKPPDVKLATDAEVEAAIDPRIKAIPLDSRGSEAGWRAFNDAAASMTTWPPVFPMNVATPAQLADVRRFAASHAGVLAKLEKALALTPWRATATYLRTPTGKTPDFFVEKNRLATFLNQRIELAIVERDATKATEAVDLRIRLDNAMRNEEARLDQNARLAFWLGEEVYIVGRAIEVVPFTEKQLLQILNLLPAPRAADKGLDRAVSRYLREIYIPQVRTPKSIDQINFYNLPLNGGNLDVVKTVRESSAFLAEFLESTRELRKTGDGPVTASMKKAVGQIPDVDLHMPKFGGKPERLIFSNWVRRTPNSLGIFASPDRVLAAHWGVRTDNLRDALRKERLSIEQIRTQLALQIYFLRHRKYPAQLRDLVSDKILAAEPMDWYSGKPLIYAPDEGLFYSVGEDGVASPHTNHDFDIVSRFGPTARASHY